MALYNLKVLPLFLVWDQKIVLCVLQNVLFYTKCILKFKFLKLNKYIFNVLSLAIIKVLIQHCSRILFGSVKIVFKIECNELVKCQLVSIPDTHILAEIRLDSTVQVRNINQLKLASLS